MGIVACKGSVRIDNYYGRAWVKCIEHEEFGTRWVLRSHFVWWKWRAQRVRRGQVLHHKDDNKLHDVISNLQLMTRADHAALHSTGKIWLEESKAKASESALKRCTPEWRTAVSARVKKQHAAGKFGRATWSEEVAILANKRIGDAHRGKPGKTLGQKRTPKQKAVYRKAARLREQKRRDGRLPPYTGESHWAYGKPGKTLGQKRTPEQCEHYRQGARKRERNRMKKASK